MPPSAHQNEPLLGSNSQCLQTCDEELHLATGEYTQQAVSERHAAIVDSCSRPNALKRRLLGLDVFRGLTMVGMILVDNQGNFDKAIWPLRETKWEGLTTADCIFPAFLFIMGVAIPISLPQNYRNRDDFWSRIRRVLRRSATLIFLGILFDFIALFHADFHWKCPRLPGVLQRLGFTYLVVSVIHLAGTTLLMVVLTLSFVSLNQVLMYAVKVPGCDNGSLTAACNAAGFIDSKLFHKCMIHPTDPEGFVSSLNAVGTVAIGWSAGLAAKEYIKDGKSIKMFFAKCGGFSVACFAVGAILTWGLHDPVIKKLWTPSFMLFTASFASATLLACCACFMRVQSSTSKWVKLNPLVWLGRNPLAIFLGMVFIEVVLIDNAKFGSTSAYDWVFQHIFVEKFGLSVPYASLVYSCVYLVVWVAVAGALFKKNIFITL